ncbi:MAG: hypothetical protein NT062_13010 [Proteobacteria bacterium]|nr:hypothetical protein [Pseudomonadota bacterium]
MSKGLRALRELFREPLLATWGLYIFLIPFKLLPSGYPQPVDAFAIFMLPFAMKRWDGKLPRPMRDVFRALTWFTIWAIVVNVGWSAILWEWGVTVLNPMYYVYNATLFLLAMILYLQFGDRFLKATLYAVLAITLFQVAASFLINFGKVRTSLFFNNSNQLGYFSLLAACLISVTQRRVGLGLVKSSIGLTGCAYLALLTASRSALIGIGVLFILLMFSNPRVIAIAALAAIGLVLSGGPVSDAIDTSQRRMTEDRDPNRNFFEDRGYDRIWENKEYLFTGAAEGHADRFADDTKQHNLEIHSSAGTILFSYGIIGVVLFTIFVWRVVRGAQRRLAFMLLPLLMHSMAHQGLRFSLLWVLLAIFVAIKLKPAVARPATAAIPPTQTRTSLMISPSRM